MSFDCTLHVVSIDTIGRFCDWFVGRRAAPEAFDARYDADELRQKMVEAVGEDAREGARFILQVLLMFCSTETPHVFSRNVAISLWEGEPFPQGCVDRWGVERHLGPLMEQWPALAGQFYTGFEGNWSTGAFVSASEVPRARRFVESLIERHPGRMDFFEPMLEVLRCAEQRGMAYWEGTDLSVSESNLSWLAAARAPLALGVSWIDLPMGYLPDLVFQQGDLLVLSETHPDVTCVVDTSRAPPVVVRHEGLFLMGADHDEEAGLLAVGRYEHENPFRLYRVEWKEARVSRLEFDSPFGDLHTVVCAADPGLVVAPSATSSRRDGVTPVVVEREGGIEPLEGLHRVQESTWGRGVFTSFPFGDGTDFVVWDRRGYRLEGGVAHDLGLEGLDLEGAFLGGGEGFASEPGVVITVDGREVVTIDREGRRTPLVPAVTGVRGVSRGPGDSVVMHQGGSGGGDIFKVYWRRSGELTRVSQQHVGVTGVVTFAVYVPSSRSVWVQVGTRGYLVPWQAVDELPREIV